MNAQTHLPPRTVAAQVRCFFGLCAAVCLVCGALTEPPTAQALINIAQTNGRLSVRTVDAPLARLVAEVSRRGGIEVIGLENLRGTVTVDFVDLPAPKALVVILNGVNYVLAQRPVKPDMPAGLVLYVQSMSDPQSSLAPLEGPIDVPALSTFVVLDAAEEGTIRDDEESEDPETLDENREGILELAQLNSEGAFGPRADIESLSDYLTADHSEIRLAAVKALAARPSTVSFGPLTEALRDESSAVRTAAVEALGRATDRQSLDKIGELLLNDVNRYMRVGALRVFALRADGESEKYLDAVLADDDAVVREAAKQLLEEFDRRRRSK